MLNAQASIPIGKHSQLGGIDKAVGLVDKREVYSRDKLHIGANIRI